AIYGSSELTTGKRLHTLFREHGVRARTELKQMIGGEGFQRLVWVPNVEEATAFARELHHRLGGELVITPAPLISPGWTQPEFLAFWETVIRTRCKAVYFGDDWEYSNGCAFEFAVAHDAGIPTYDAGGESLTLEQGVEKIVAAVAELEAEGFDASKLRESLARLETVRGALASRG
ncbi:MAG TPA: DUF4406 domain-containing protein, partial [Thermoanaerobaculia bacterium]|nr:DUF4406 domain-containing protein [Thermoanaerobaculia bacterium]